jgi:hypothetical protein
MGKALREYWRIGIDVWHQSTRLEQSLERAMKEPTSLSHAVAAQVDIILGRTTSAIEPGERAVQLNANDVEDQIRWRYMSAAGRGGGTGSIECVFKGFARFLVWLILLDFGE